MLTPGSGSNPTNSSPTFSEEVTLSSSTYGTFSRIHHILSLRTNLNKFKRIKIISIIYFEHSSTKLQEEKWENYKHMQTKQPATKNPNGSKKKSNRKSENTLRQMQIKMQLFFFFFYSSLDIPKVVLRDKFIAIQVCLKMKKNLRQQPRN